MKLGTKSYDPHPYNKVWARRHVRKDKNGAKREERAAERTVRQRGKGACRDYHKEY